MVETSSTDLQRSLISMAFRYVSSLRVRSSGLSRAGARAHPELENDDRVRPEAAQHAGHRGVEAGEDRAHADNGAGPDDHAQHRQKRAQLMRRGWSAAPGRCRC